MVSRVSGGSPAKIKNGEPEIQEWMGLALSRWLPARCSVPFESNLTVVYLTVV
jgi:hypothetical protein